MCRAGRFWQRPLSSARWRSPCSPPTWPATGCRCTSAWPQRHGVEVLCFGGGERYVPPWFADLDAQLAARAVPGPAARRRRARRSRGPRLRRRDRAVRRRRDPAGRLRRRAARTGARSSCGPRCGRSRARSAHALALPGHPPHLPPRRRGGRLRRARPPLRGRDPRPRRRRVRRPAVRSSPSCSRGRSAAEEVARSAPRTGSPPGPLVLYVGRLAPEKGVEVLLDAWRVGRRRTRRSSWLGDGPLRRRAGAVAAARGCSAPLARAELPVAYAAAEFALLPSVPTPRFLEPWGLVCNEAMHQGRPVIATAAGRRGRRRAGARRRDRSRRAGRRRSARWRRRSRGCSPTTRCAGPARRGRAAGGRPPTPTTRWRQAFDRALATAMSPSPTGPPKQPVSTGAAAG